MEQDYLELELPNRDLTESELQQIDVFSQALHIYRERSQTRADLWAQFDVHDAIHHLNSKLARVRHACEAMDRDLTGSPEALERKERLKEEALDSFRDMINYAAFGVRHLTGEKPRG